MGGAGVGVISMKGASLALLCFATAQLKSFFGCGRAVWCMLPLGFGRFMHLVVLYSYQGADHDPEQLALTLSSCLMLPWVNSVLLLVGSLA